MVRWSPTARWVDKVTRVSLNDGRENTLCDAIPCCVVVQGVR